MSTSKPPRPKPVDALKKAAAEPVLIQPEDQEGLIQEISKRMDEAVTSARVSYWTVGYYLDLALENEGKYGSRTIEKAAEALSRPPRLLWDALKFYKAHPDLDTVKNMSIEWSSARVLLTVKDTEVRSQLQQKAEDDNLTVLEVKALVKEAKADTAEEKNKTKESAQPRRVKPISYFKRLHKQLTEFKEQMAIEFKERFVHYQVIGDIELTTDEEYNECVTKVGEVVALTNQLVRFLETNAAAMPKEMDESLDEAEEAEKKK